MIHKSGLITGGKSSHNTSKKWEEKEIQGSFSLTANWGKSTDCFFLALHRTRESLLTQMRDLNKTKPRGRADEGPMAEMTRLESTLMVAKEDRVCGFAVAWNWPITQLTHLDRMLLD